MNINLVCPIVVLENELNPNIRKSDVKKFKLLVDNNNNLVNVIIDDNKNLKTTLRAKITSIINSENFHLEQVYTLGEEKYYFDNNIDIIYLAITNAENIKDLSQNYKLIDFSISNNNIVFDNQNYDFKTKEHIISNNIEYFHEINVEDIKLEKELLEIIIAYKQLRVKLDHSDILFKFMPKYFTLEELRIIYEMIKEVSVDKSNFRKKIVKYCVETDIDITKKGYRPSKLYTFKVLKGDIWLWFFLLIIMVSWGKLKKAKEIYEISEEPVIADDSGLCITALNDFPGVLAHRFLGEDANDEDRNYELIRRVNEYADRSAKVVCSLVYYDGKKILVGEGILKGQITNEPRGKNGFGFDPIFELENGKTLAEITSEQKNMISARHLAAVDLSNKIKKSKDNA